MKSWHWYDCKIPGDKRSGLAHSVTRKYNAQKHYITITFEMKLRNVFLTKVLDVMQVRISTFQKQKFPMTHFLPLLFANSPLFVVAFPCYSCNVNDHCLTHSFVPLSNIIFFQVSDYISFTIFPFDIFLYRLCFQSSFPEIDWENS